VTACTYPQYQYDTILASALACGDHRVKAKFHYAIWLEASNQLRTCFKPASNQIV